MSVVKVRSRRQVTIPKEIFNRLHMEIGDFIEAKAEDQKIVFIPKKLVTKANVIPLSKKEQTILKKAKAKMEKIKQNLSHSKGLEQEEIDVAAKVGLIDPDQTWWWTEEWQKGEREAQKEINEGKLMGPFNTLEQFKSAIET
jgi:bifunctional DNA-binding transcriptional regulator/antitoxin component of YhaV-PrlF toxin-antitoxin module